MTKKVLSFLLLGCFLLNPNPLLGLGDSLTSLKSPYQKVLRKYTKGGAVYSITTFDTIFKWFATYHSPEFRQAFLREFDKKYPQGPPELAEQLMQSQAGEGQSEFFIALYAKSRGLKRMTGKKNLWDISLVVEDHVYKPITVEEVNLTPFQRYFYPYLKKWYLGYRVIFPVGIGNLENNKVSLQLNSVGGNSAIVF